MNRLIHARLCISIPEKSVGYRQTNIPKESIVKRPWGGVHFLFRGRCLSFVLRDIRFAVCSFAVPREPGFSPVGPRHPPLLIRTVFHPLVCFPLLGRGPMNRRGLFVFSAFCPSAFPLFTPPLTGEGKRERRGKRGEWPLPFSRSQTVPHKLRYPSALCAAYLSISV